MLDSFLIVLMSNINTVQWTYDVRTTPPPHVMDIFVCSKVVEFIMYNYHYDLLISYLMFLSVVFLENGPDQGFTL